MHQKSKIIHRLSLKCISVIDYDHRCLKTSLNSLFNPSHSKSWSCQWLKLNKTTDTPRGLKIIARGSKWAVLLTDICSLFVPHIGHQLRGNFCVLINLKGLMRAFKNTVQISFNCQPVWIFWSLTNRVWILIIYRMT